MYRTVVFNSTFPDDWEFDTNENPTSARARELAEVIVAKLRPRVASVSEVQQHEYYGWAFAAVTEHACFYNVINPADECYLTISMDSYTFKAILLQQPQQSFERYCDVLDNVLREIPEVSSITWKAYQR